MKKSNDSLSVSLLFTAAVCGVALGCLVYIGAPSDTLSPLHIPAPHSTREAALFFRGTLASLSLLPVLGLVGGGVCPFGLLVLLRTCRLTLDAALAYLYCPFGEFVWQMLLCFLLGFLYACFARLSMLYAKRKRWLSRRQKRQYIYDFLFFCGLCTVIRMLFDPIALLQFIIPKGHLF